VQLALGDIVTELESSGKAVFVCGIGRQSDEIKSVVESTKFMSR
jgi:hypothetical protein